MCYGVKIIQICDSPIINNYTQNSFALFTLAISLARIESLYLLFISRNALV